MKYSKIFPDHFSIIFIIIVFMLTGCSGCGGGGGAGDAGSGSEAKIILAWDSNTESDLAGYKVYWGTTSRTTSGVYGNNKDVGMATQLTPTETAYALKETDGLVKGQRYYIAVTAYNNAGYESTFSNEIPDGMLK